MFGGRFIVYFILVRFGVIFSGIMKGRREKNKEIRRLLETEEMRRDEVGEVFKFIFIYLNKERFLFFMFVFNLYNVFSCFTGVNGNKYRWIDCFRIVRRSF